MKNPEQWKPSKYIYRNGRLIASRNPSEVSVSSRLVADLTAALYQEHLPNYASGKLLDLGCGKIPLYFVYREYADEYICVDWENTFHKNEHLDYECDITKPLPFGGDEFDTIILSDVLEHIPEPDQLWREMARILTPGGKLIMNVPFLYMLHEKPHDYYRFTEFALRRFADGSGLTVLEILPIGGSLEVLTDIFAKNVQPLPLIGEGIAIIVQALSTSFARTSLGRRTARKTSQYFPLAYFLVAEKPQNYSTPTPIE